MLGKTDRMLVNLVGSFRLIIQSVVTIKSYFTHDKDVLYSLVKVQFRKLYSRLSRVLSWLLLLAHHCYSGWPKIGGSWSGFSGETLDLLVRTHFQTSE